MKPALAVAAAGVLAIAAPSPARAEQFGQAVLRSADILCLNLRHGQTLKAALRAAYEPLEPFYVAADDVERQGITKALYTTTDAFCPALHAAAHQ